MTDDGTEDTGAADGYSVVHTTVIDEITEVRVYDETLPHIASEHPEFRNMVPSLEHAIHDTIANPTSVRQSNVELHTSSFKFCSARHQRGRDQHLVVPVKAIEGTSGLLKTAYFTDTVSGDVLWSAEDD